MKKFKLKKLDEKNVRIWIGIVVVCSVFFVALFLFMSRPSELERLDADYLDVVDKKVINNNVKESYKDVYELSDYSIYGESLNLYQKKYNGLKVDDTLGKIVVLNNLKTEEEITVTFSGGIDAGIPLGQLEEGFYEIYMYDHYTKKRLYFDDVVHSENFSTLRREGKVKNIRLNADKDMFEDISMDRNYAFLTVVESIPKVKVNDVIINPGGNVYNNALNGVEVGAVSNLASEPQEMSELAELVKKYLEQAGLRVKIARQPDESLSYYGQAGRVSQGYESQAKVYLNLAMIEDNDVTRPFIKASPHTSAFLANEISYTFQKQNIEMENIVTNTALEWGVLYDEMFYDEKGKPTEHETQPGLRETGGKGTYAGTLDFAKENSKYKNNYGMESVIVYVANVQSKDSLEYYHKRQEMFAKKIADGILSYYQIGGIESETTTA